MKLILTLKYSTENEYCNLSFCRCSSTLKFQPPHPVLIHTILKLNITKSKTMVYKIQDFFDNNIEFVNRISHYLNYIKNNVQNNIFYILSRTKSFLLYFRHYINCFISFEGWMKVVCQCLTFGWSWTLYLKQVQYSFTHPTIDAIKIFLYNDTSH